MKTAVQNKFVATKRNQRGIMLLEGLIAILVFSLGILAIVGMQASTLAHTSQAKYRTDAAFLANKLIGQMWAETNANMSQYQTGGAKFSSWFTPELDNYLPPGRNSATVTVSPFAATPGLNATGGVVAVTGYTVNIDIQWRAPSESNSLPAHSYRVVTTIVRN